MKRLQLRYNLLHILYWMASCCVCGYIAVFLQYRGMSNTEIGIVTGGAGVVSIFLSPFVSSLINKIKGLTIKMILTIIFITLVVIFMVLALFELPTVFIMVLYMMLWSMLISTVPFLSMIAMNYIQSGETLNFGFARGLGSVSYAVSAMMLGRLIEYLNPTVLAYVFFIAIILALVVLYWLPDCKVQVQSAKKEGNILGIIKKYKVFFFLLLGFSCTFAASTTLSTYLVNIVRKLGGSTSLYGVAVFFMAASEMPVMTITPRLIRKFDSVTLIMVASFCYILRNFTICLAPNLPILFIGMLMQSMSYGLMTAVITYYVTYNLESHDQMMGQTMIGIMSSGLGSMIGNIFGGVLQDTFGIQSMLVFACTITVIGVIITFITGFYSKKLARNS